MIFLLLAVAYLLGAVPFAYLLVRLTTGSDIRQSGSGNVGATNALRANRFAGVLTLLCDAGKGALAVWLAQRHGGESWMPMAAGIAAIVGHMFPVFLRFQGGKGVATGCGAFVMLAPRAVAAVFALFVLVVALSRFISLGSVVSAAAFPFFALLFGYGFPIVWGCILGSVLIVAKHRSNIRRILRGEESRFTLRS